jgi:hypothetical protein
LGGAGRSKPSDPLRRLHLFDWLFVGMAWLTCLWLIFIVMEQFNPDPTVGFDFMPVVTGIPTILIGWRAVRLHEQVDEALAGLNDGAAFIVTEENSWGEFLADMDLTVKRWALGIAILITVIMLGINVYLITPDLGNLDLEIVATTTIRTVVMAIAGWLIGLLLGRLAGFARLFSVMDKHEIRLAGLSTTAAQIAMRSLERVFSFATLVTSLLCMWFAAWWIAWALGYEGYAHEWRWPFLALWAVSFALYLWAARAPALAFQRRLDTLYGDSAGRERIDRNLGVAEAELVVLKAAGKPSRRMRAETFELERYVKHLKELRFRSQLLNPRLLDALLVGNILLIAIPVACFLAGVGIR